MDELKQDDQLEHTTQQLCEDTGEGQAYPCWRHDMMMMMIYI